VRICNFISQFESRIICDWRNRANVKLRNDQRNGTQIREKKDATINIRACTLIEHNSLTSAHMHGKKCSYRSERNLLLQFLNRYHEKKINFWQTANSISNEQSLRSCFLSPLSSSPPPCLFSVSNRHVKEGRES